MTRLASTAPTHRGPARDAAAYRLLVLYATDDAAVSRSFGLGAARAPIGRADQGPQSLVLEDAEVSRSHAVIERSEDGQRFRIEDSGSRNGTFVNGVRITQADLRDGDVVRIGGHVLLFEMLTLEDCEQLLEPTDGSTVLLGESVALRRIRTAIRRVAPLAAPVLLLGESGVGKERIAEELHRLSGRSGPFVPVNCAAIAENLAESELFGHQPGAFTGAVRGHRGLFREAHGGTLLLDEFGELPAALQAKLLRVLATGEVRGVGETRATTVDVRIIAATNVDLEKVVAEGGFRGDLYSRLMGLTVRIPPLRERRADILVLAERLAQVGRERLTPDVAEALVLHAWLYNVRELVHTLRGVCVHKPTGAIELIDLPANLGMLQRARAVGVAPSSVSELPPALTVRRDTPPTRDELLLVLAHFEGNVARVASFFGKDRRQVYRWAERVGIDLGSRKEPE